MGHYIAAKGMRANVPTKQGMVKVTDAERVKMDGNDPAVKQALVSGIITKWEAPAPPAAPPADKPDEDAPPDDGDKPKE